MPAVWERRDDAFAFTLDNAPIHAIGREMRAGRLDALRALAAESGVNDIDLYRRDSGAGVTHRLPMTMGAQFGKIGVEIG